MNEKEKEQGSFNAFPIQTAPGVRYGLSKREYFAGLAMQGMIGSDSYETHSIADIAAYAKDMADALINELSK